MKKMLRNLCVCTMAISLFPMTAFAEEEILLISQQETAPQENTVFCSVDVSAIEGESFLLSSEAVVLEDGDTAWTVIERIFNEKNISYTTTGSAEDGSLYLVEIGGVAELDHGIYSGWLYYVNGEFPEFSMTALPLESGDSIELQYVTSFFDETYDEIEETETEIEETEIVEVEIVEVEIVEIETPEVEVVETVYKQFEDVVASDVFYDAVNYVVAEGIFYGVSDTKFVPHQKMNLSMASAVLHRMSGDTTYTTGEFWYSASMEWAKANGIAGADAPTSDVSAEQFVAMLSQYATLFGMDYVAETASTTAITRADVAVMLQQFLQNS